MWRQPLAMAFLCVAIPSHPAIAEETDPACRLERTGRFDLTPSVENEVIIATGDVCQLDVINVVIETHDGRQLYETAVLHRELHLGTSGRTAAEDFEWTMGELTHPAPATLPRLEHFSIEYELRIDREDYERLREAGAPAYTFHHYYAGRSYVVFDSRSGEAVLALRYGT